MIALAKTAAERAERSVWARSSGPTPTATPSSANSSAHTVAPWIVENFPFNLAKEPVRRPNDQPEREYPDRVARQELEGHSGPGRRGRSQARVDQLRFGRRRHRDPYRGRKIPHRRGLLRQSTSPTRAAPRHLPTFSRAGSTSTTANLDGASLHRGQTRARPRREHVDAGA